MDIARYIISKPPYVMRNIPKYYTNQKLQEQQVLKIDIRNTDPGRQLWGRMEDTSEHAQQDCIIVTLGAIQAKEKQASEKRTHKRTTTNETEKPTDAKRKRTQ